MHRIDEGDLGSVRGMLFNFVKLQENGRERKLVTQTEFEVCELLNWMWQATNADPILTRHISTDVLSKAIERADFLGICRNRLWNQAVASGDEKHLAILMQLTGNGDIEADVATNQRFKHLRHESCSAESCLFSNVDSTNVKQLHKCPREDCELLEFPLDDLLLETTTEPYTWWIEDDKPYLTTEIEYVAISHVWSDGTGAGVQKDGYVNSCLFNYFKEVAMEVGCKAIWWDTISLPRKGEFRKRAIGRINQDFLSAKCTVIHDQYLVNFPWVDDGTPCLTLTLSSWFTRAWIALELLYSTDVRVIFRHPTDPTRKVIKKLDTEVILEGSLCSRKHFIASRLIDDLRHQQLNTVSSILEVLRTRSTSKPHDMIIIAGLLVGQKPDTSRIDMAAELTRSILRALQTVESSFLFHSHATIADRGGFSWCPFNLLQGPDPSTLYNRDPSALVSNNGAISTAFLYRILRQEDQVQKTSDFSRALLVKPVDVGTLDLPRFSLHLIDCHYVGAVNVELKPSDARIILVRIGHVECPPVSTASRIVNKYWGQPHFANVIVTNTRELIHHEEQKILAALLTVDVDYAYTELQAFYRRYSSPWRFSLSRLKHAGRTIIAFLLINYRSYDQSISAYEKSINDIEHIQRKLKEIDRYIDDRHEKWNNMRRVLGDIRALKSKYEAEKERIQTVKTKWQDLLRRFKQQIIAIEEKIELYESSQNLLLRTKLRLEHQNESSQKHMSSHQHTQPDNCASDHHEEEVKQASAVPEYGSSLHEQVDIDVLIEIKSPTDDVESQINPGKELQSLQLKQSNSGCIDGHESGLDFLSRFRRELETLREQKNEVESGLEELAEGEAYYQGMIETQQNMLLRSEQILLRDEAGLAEIQRLRNGFDDISRDQSDLGEIHVRIQKNKETNKERLATLESLMSESALSDIDKQDSGLKKDDGSLLSPETVLNAMGHIVSSVASGLLSFFGNSFGDDDSDNLVY
ncbi:hypothetical protein TSTA_042220 [Talaromyces stipitatus ATCC 10500]|uniref:Heterokaryon incompatibility domain-containing protein n=1 Tax=Talaromyces stipitatus (strain ATCC 10500 / CBS 375.48 / QM 6759 / NRRL 1006) TaxID=441959 RepID=B8MJT0_TALSN|nr:uncharacterized protein TSTA_042220 [Talaromyces stipitatus ATCC 10500]EED14747.1 hypothetical protein TSTA_042220 [Talaromyces stipitatus ATCC 10500]